jgi:hypothetical protein
MQPPDSRRRFFCRGGNLIKPRLSGSEWRAEQKRDLLSLLSPRQARSPQIRRRHRPDLSRPSHPMRDDAHSHLIAEHESPDIVRALSHEHSQAERDQQIYVQPLIKNTAPRIRSTTRFRFCWQFGRQSAAVLLPPLFGTMCIAPMPALVIRTRRSCGNPGLVFAGNSLDTLSSTCILACDRGVRSGPPKLAVASLLQADKQECLFYRWQETRQCVAGREMSSELLARTIRSLAYCGALT